MLFVNETGKVVKVRFNDGKETSGFRWVTVKHGDVVDVDEGYARRLGFSVVQGSVKGVKVDNDVKSERGTTVERGREGLDGYVKLLSRVKGVGPKTLKDILRVYSSAEELKLAVSKGSVLPFRDDIASELKKIEW